MQVVQLATIAAEDSELCLEHDQMHVPTCHEECEWQDSGFSALQQIKVSETLSGGFLSAITEQKSCS